MKLYREIEKSFPKIRKLFTADGLEDFRNAALSDLSDYHFGLGTQIRNSLLYPKKSVLRRLFVENGVDEPDEMSAFIIRLFHYHVSKT